MDNVLDFLKNIDWTTISGNLIVVGLFIWAIIKLFSKSFINSLGEQTVELLFTKKKKELELSIESASKKALAEYQAELDKMIIAFKSDYTFFYTERAKACIELFKKIAELYDNAILLTKSITDSGTTNTDVKNRAEVYDNSLNELREFHNQNRIFLQKELSDNILTLFNNIGKLCSEFSDVYVQLILLPSDNKDYNAKYNRLKSISTEVIAQRETLDKILESIRNLIQPKESKE